MILKNISAHAKNPEEKQHVFFYKPCMCMGHHKRDCTCMTVIHCGLI